MLELEFTFIFSDTMVIIYIKTEIRLQALKAKLLLSLHFLPPRPLPANRRIFNIIFFYCQNEERTFYLPYVVFTALILMSTTVNLYCIDKPVYNISMSKSSLV